MFDETPDKEDSPAGDTPIVERTEEEWCDHFRTLFRNKLDSIFEIAKQIKAFHDQYNSDPFKWRGRPEWGVICMRVIGIHKTTCSQYETIHRVFDSGMLADIRDKLPARSYTLYWIARAFEAHEPTTSAALQKGIVSPAMEQKEAKQLFATALQTARREADEADEELRELFEPGQSAEPRQPAEPRQSAEPSSAPDHESTDEDETLFGKVPEPRRSDKKSADDGGWAEAQAALTAAQKKKKAVVTDDDIDAGFDVLTGSSWTHPKLGINAAIKKLASELDDEFGSRLVRHLLILRAEHWRIFREISHWEAKYGAMPVTLALRQLGYQPSIETMIV
jgi:hypothetical protein